MRNNKVSRFIETSNDASAVVVEEFFIFLCIYFIFFVVRESSGSKYKS